MVQLKDRLTVQANLALHPVCKALMSGKEEMNLGSLLLVAPGKPKVLSIGAGAGERLLVPRVS